MTRKPHSTSLVLLLICIFAFWWGISVLSQSVIPMSSTGSQTVSQNVPVASMPNPILVHESVAAGTHTYTGAFTPRSACDSFGSGIRYNAEGGGHVSILLMTEPSLVNCAQAADVTPGDPFTVSIKLAAGNNPIFDGVLVDGVKVPAQLVAN